MNIEFFKFDGAGNDFVIIDIRRLNLQLDESLVARICHRRFGVGADGLMTLDNHDTLDFEMRYYNSDGRLGSMCGNGGRCISAFANMLQLGHIDEQTGHRCFEFKAFDGVHHSEMLEWSDDEGAGVVKLGMGDVPLDGVRPCLDGWFLDTGSPHYVQWVDDLEHFDVVGEGRRLRNNIECFPAGTNVDFIEKLPDGRLFVRTYERGVEDETWACGTGVTACAIVTGNKQLSTRGGDFKVSFNTVGNIYSNVQLIGPVSLNFKGILML